MELLEHKKNYVKGQCLHQTTYSSFGGKHTRNIFTGQETREYSHFLKLVIVFEEMILTEPFDFLPRKTIKSIMTLFWDSAAYKTHISMSSRDSRNFREKKLKPKL